MLLNSDFKKLNKIGWTASAYEFLFVNVFNNSVEYVFNCDINDLYNELLKDNDIKILINEIELYELENKFPIDSDVEYNNMILT